MMNRGNLSACRYVPKSIIMSLPRKEKPVSAAKLPYNVTGGGVIRLTLVFRVRRDADESVRSGTHVRKWEETIQNIGSSRIVGIAGHAIFDRPCWPSLPAITNQVVIWTLYMGNRFKIPAVIWPLPMRVVCVMLESWCAKVSCPCQAGT